MPHGSKFGGSNEYLALRQECTLVGLFVITANNFGFRKGTLLVDFKCKRLAGVGRVMAGHVWNVVNDHNPL